jgi:ABC-2 type transport system permease protein
MFYYLCASQIIYILFPNVSSNLSQLVKKGDIISWLLKPISIFRQFFFEELGKSFYKFIFISLPTLIIVILVIQTFPKFILLNIIKFILVFTLSYLFVFIFEVFIGTFSFYTFSNWGVQSFKYDVITLLSGRFLPISLYPDWIRTIIEYMPFKIMYYYPLIVLNNKIEQKFINIIAYQIVWNIILAIITYIFYKIAIKKIMIQGG